MQRIPIALVALALLASAACSDDDGDTTAATCAPACGACQTCDVSADEPVCVDSCAVGTTCQDSKCVAPEVKACKPDCSPCQMCDTSGAAAVCVDVCAAGTSCQDKSCVADAAAKCTPTCGKCQMCDTSGATPTCIDNCSAGTNCEDDKCVAPTVASCEPACGPCQMCDTSGAAPACIDNCATGLSCDQGACTLPADPCAGQCASCQTCDSSYGVPFCVDSCASGLLCDAAANVCRPTGATGFDHSKLAELKGPFTADEAGGKAVTAKCLGCHKDAGQQMLTSAHWTWMGPTPNLEGSKTAGKNNLVNNFCVAIPSNEKRCSQCHAGYGYANKDFDFKKTEAMDCLVCHSSAKYLKGPKTAGAPDPSVDMVAAAQSVGSPTRAACGRCHFKAGGGDNVKKGDIGSAMANPAAAADVHMGSAKLAFTCATCHVADGHKLPGQGVHLPVSEGRVGCADCHSATPHAKASLNNHALDVACQTCHVPAFSRQQPTKMDWDWSTAGNRTLGTEGIVTGKAGEHTVQTYNYMKGNFVWQDKVRPTYAWYDGRATRMTLNDSFADGEGSKDKPVFLGGPVAAYKDSAAKIFPFKVMRGRQPVATKSRKVLSPKLFGPGGFWGAIPAKEDYTAKKVEDLWTSTLTAGAAYAGQIDKDAKFSGRATGDMPWDWAYTELWLGINHEVALKKDTLGCSDCHGADIKVWDWKALGYACDPMSEPAKCGSRHL